MRPVMLVLLLGFACAGQESDSDWGNIGKLPQDAKVRIVRPGAEKSNLTGAFRSWTPDAVTLARSGGETSLERKQVEKVFRVEKGSRLRSTLLGAVIGFAPGFALGAAAAGSIADENNPSFGMRMEGGAIFGVIGAGIGAGIGAATGGTKSTLIYRAR